MLESCKDGEQSDRVSKRLSASTLRCKSKNKRGEPCQATVINADGLCSAHSGQDMRAIGRLGGKSSGAVKPEHVPVSLREELRTLDPAIVRAAIEQALAGGNESARVSAVKLLADVDAFGRHDECPSAHAAKPRCHGSARSLIA